MCPYRNLDIFKHSNKLFRENILMFVHEMNSIYFNDFIFFITISRFCLKYIVVRL